MNLRQVEVFAAIMKTGSISGAARLLRVSAPAVSKMIRRTEDQLGYALFERHVGRLHPTPEARSLFSVTESALDAVAQVGAFAQSLRHPGSGVLRIAANPSFGGALLPTVLKDLTAKEDLRRFEIMTVAHQAVVERIFLKQADFGLSMVPACHPTLVDKCLGAAPLRIAVPRSWDLAKRESVCVSDLTGLPLVGYLADTPIGEAIAAFTGKTLDNPGVGIYVRYPMIACMFVETGLWAAVIDPFVALRGTSQAMVVIPIKDAPLVNAWLIRRGDQPLCHLGRRLSAAIRRNLMGYHSD